MNNDTRSLKPRRGVHTTGRGRLLSSLIIVLTILLFSDVETRLWAQKVPKSTSEVTIGVKEREFDLASSADSEPVSSREDASTVSNSKVLLSAETGLKAKASAKTNDRNGDSTQEVDFDEQVSLKDSFNEFKVLKEGPQAWFNSENGWFGRSGISTSIKMLLATSALSLAPAVLLMLTSFVRISVVLSLLRQAIGAGQVPSNQVVAALSIFLTILIMTPVWNETYNVAIGPYSAGEISNVEAFEKGQEPIRNFLWKQIEKTGNADMINMFTQYLPESDRPEYFEDVPWRVLAPSFLLSELKIAFLIGFQIFLPFLIIDVVVSCVLVSTGMMMLPPAIVSLPFKLALFVLADGWTLVVKSLLDSFAWIPK